MVLCHFLETNQDKFKLTDKNVIELGAGTGLITIVASLLGMEAKVISFGTCFDLLPFNTHKGRLCPGAKVTSTDLPEVLGNLQYNVIRNTKDRCKYVPLVGLILYKIYTVYIYRYIHCLNNS